MKRLLAALLFAATVTGGTAAFANVLPTAATKSLGAGSAPIGKCDSAAWTIVPQYSADTLTVTGVTVSGIPTSCLAAGGTLRVAGRTTAVSATGSVTYSVASVQPITVAFSGAVASLPTTAVTHLAAVVEGA